MRYVRLKMSPTKTSEVSESAYTDYKRWGLVLEEFDAAPETVDASASNDLGAEVSRTTAANTSKRKTANS